MQCNIGAGGYYFDYGDCCSDPDGLCIAPNSNNRYSHTKFITYVSTKKNNTIVIRYNIFFLI